MKYSETIDLPTSDMENPLKFKTNIKCSGCIATVSPHLNESIGEGNWQVDLNSPLKVLTVNVELNQDKVKTALEKAGYKAEQLD